MFSPSEPVVSDLFPVQCEPAPASPSKPFASRSGSESFYEDIARLVVSSVSPPDSTNTVDDDLCSSPGLSPTHPSPAFYYEPSFGSPSSPTDMYDTDPPSAYPASSSSLYQQPLATPQNAYSFTGIRESDGPASYPSDSPSPGDVHSSADFSNSYTDSNPQSYQADPDQRYNPSSFPSITSSSLLDQRRMSEPAILALPNPYSTSYSMAYNNSSRSSYAPSLHRGASIGSLRDLHLQHQQSHYPSSRTHSGWKTEADSHHMQHDAHGRSETLESPLSPFQSGFTLGASPSMAQGLQYSPIAEDHGSPTGTSTSPLGTSRPSALSSGETDPDTDGNRSPMDPNSKTYSFVALPGNAVKKRPRRRYDEIERLYQCSWPDCTKAYGTLNHLNAHVTMQKHGSKRSPSEFKELRKQWRKAKKESEAVALSGVSRRPGNYIGHEHELTDPHTNRYPSSHQRYGGTTHPGHSRYLSGDDLGYSAVERDERGMPFGARARYDTSPTSPWNSSFPPSTRSSSAPFLSSSLPSQSSMQHFHNHSHSLHQLHFNYPTESSDRPLTIPSPPQMHPGRLPPDSMLLTPLTGYESQARETLPPLQVGSNMTYDPEAYYEGSSGRRSASAHASMSRGSGDDY